jgi:hypothetical protein
MWIAISAASAKGLGALARSASSSNMKAELAAVAADVAAAHDVASHLTADPEHRRGRK